MLIKILAVQSRLGHRFSLAERLMLFKHKADFVCLPEYSQIGPDCPDYIRAALQYKNNLDYLKELSLTLSTTLISGTVVEPKDGNLYNCSYLINRGEIIGEYRKLNPTSIEIKKGISPGRNLFAIEIEGVRIAILICADALESRLFNLLYEKDIDIIFIPTVSPYRSKEKIVEKFRRDEDIFVDGASRAGAYIVKVCGTGTIFGNRLQGRTSFASPWGILKRIEPYAEDSPGLLSIILDIDEIREFKEKKQMICDSINSDFTVSYNKKKAF